MSIGDFHQDLVQQTHAARDRYAASLGTVASDVLAPVINPAFMGGPRWPDLRQAWRTIRRGQNTIILSDGLADPFTDDPNPPGPHTGFGLEVLAETTDDLSTAPAALMSSWIFDLVREISRNVAYDGGFRERLDRLGVTSFEIPTDNPAFEPVLSPNGTVGLLLGLPSPDYTTEFQGPVGTIKILTAKVLTPNELDYVITHRAAGRAELAQRFATTGTHHRSALFRDSVL